MVDPIQPNTVFSKPQQSDVTGHSSLNSNTFPLSPRVFSFEDTIARYFMNASHYSVCEPLRFHTVAFLEKCLEIEAPLKPGNGCATCDGTGYFNVCQEACNYCMHCNIQCPGCSCVECKNEGFILYYDSPEDGRGCYEVACPKCRRVA